MPSAVDHNLNTINVITSMTSKIHHYASNVIRHTKSLSWVLRLKELYAAQILHQAICKLRGEEARRDGVGRNMLWSQLDGELPAQMGCRCFARGVHDCSCHSVNIRPYLEDCETYHLRRYVELSFLPLN